MDLSTYLSELEYLVNIDSGSDDSTGLRRMADFFSEKFRQIGWLVEEHDFAPDPGVCLACTNRKADHYDLMLVGHMDTVYPAGTCAQRPFRIEGNRAYGPGTADMKQGCLLMYHLLKDLPPEINDALNIVAIFNHDEEIGSRNSRTVYLPYAEKTDFAFVYEAQANTGARCVRRKGAMGLKIHFTGKDGHCGFVFQNGAKSAVSEMAKWIVALDGLQDRERDTTVNVGTASGGTKTNIVPAHASMTVSIRYWLPDEPQRVNALLDQLLEDAGSRGIAVEIEGRGGGRPPLIPTEQGQAYLDHITELGRAHGIDVLFRPRGGVSDANIIAQCGVICLDGMGPSGGEGHCDQEYVLLDSIQPNYDFSALLIKDLAERKA